MPRTRRKNTALVQRVASLERHLTKLSVTIEGGTVRQLLTAGRTVKGAPANARIRPFHEVLIDAIAKSLGTWRKELDKRFEELERRPVYRFVGTFVEGTEYEPGNIAVRSGSSWICTATTRGDLRQVRGLELVLARRTRWPGRQGASPAMSEPPQLLPGAIDQAVANCMAAFDQQVKNEADPLARAAMAKARPQIEELSRRRAREELGKALLNLDDGEAVRPPCHNGAGRGAPGSRIGSSLPNRRSSILTIVPTHALMPT